MENYSIGLMYQHQSKWYKKSWLESQLGKARPDAELELAKKYPGLKVEVRNISPGEGTFSTVKDNIVELIEKFDLVIFDEASQVLPEDAVASLVRARQAVVAIGVAFAAQEIAAVPATSRDAPLDLVLTEREVIDLRRA